MRVLLALLLCCLVALSIAQTPSDLCSFPAQPIYTAWAAGRQSVLDCFNSVPFDNAKRNTLVQILNYTWNAYSFHDYVATPIPPYNVQVRQKKKMLLFPLSPFLASPPLYLGRSRRRCMYL